MKQTLCLAVLLLVPSAASAKSKLAAKVDGKSIRRSEAAALLWHLHGREAVETLVDRALIKQEAKRRSIKIDMKLVDKRIEAIKESLPKGTSIDARLKKNGLTLKKLKDDISFELLRDKVVIALAQVSVSSSEVRAAFEANQEKLGVLEAVRLYHILVRTQREAEDIEIALKAGADFKKLTAAKSLDHLTRARRGSGLHRAGDAASRDRKGRLRALPG